MRELEHDMIIAWTLNQPDNRSGDKRGYEAKISKAADLLTRFQYSKARQYLQSNGLGGHNNREIIEQMRRKHPWRKEEIDPLSDGIWGLGGMG